MTPVHQSLKGGYPCTRPRENLVTAGVNRRHRSFLPLRDQHRASRTATARPLSSDRRFVFISLGEEGAKYEKGGGGKRRGNEPKRRGTNRHKNTRGGRKTADATQVQGCPPPGEKKEPAAPGESRKRAVRQRSGVPGIKKTRGVLRFSGSKPEEETKLLTAATPEERGRPEAQERKKKNLLFSCRQSAESAGEDSRAVREERFVFELRLGNFERGRRPPVREFFFARASDSASQPAGRRRARGFC